MKGFQDIDVFKTLYNALIRSHLDYCSTIWSPKSKSWVDKIERVQKKFVQQLCFQSNLKYNSSDYVKLCAIFRLPTLECRREAADAILFHKILRNHVNCSDLVSSVFFHLPPRRTRHTNVFTSSQRSRLKVRKDSFFPRTITLVNNLTSSSLDIFDFDITSFKRNLLNILQWLSLLLLINYLSLSLFYVWLLFPSILSYCILLSRILWCLASNWRKLLCTVRNKEIKK